MTRRVAGLGVLLLLTACGTRGPRPIAWGQEPCAHCHMTIADPRFVAELLTGTGRIFAFDDAGCLAAFVAGGLAPGAVRSVWVASFVAPDSLLDATHAVYLQSDAPGTPMASGLAALRPGPEADSVKAAIGGTLLSWRQVLALPHTHGPPA